MDTRLRNLKIAFELASPEAVYSALVDRSTFLRRRSDRYIDVSGMSESCYISLSRKLGKNYSIDEIRHMYAEMQDMCAERDSIPRGLFQLLVGFDLDVFCYDNGVPVCKRSRLMNLRRLSLILGQDIFTMSFLAYLTLEGRIPCQNKFDWDTKVETDDHRLKDILRQGLAENHFHLEGSTPLFSLSWIALMNHPQIISKFFSDLYGEETPFDEHRLETILFSDDYHPLGWERSLRLAARIRTRLFCLVNGITYDANDFSQIDYDFADAPQLNNTVTGLQLEYGCKFKQPDTSKKCLDYAIKSSSIYLDYDSKNRFLCGERELLYQCFLNCYRGSFREDVQNAFYLYLLIKSRFRAELVQVNRETGFANFSIYQGRKATFWKQFPEYMVESRRLTVNSAFETGTIQSLELRLQPKKTASEDYRCITDEDNCVLFADNEHVLAKSRKPVPLYSKTEQIELGINLPFFYVLHFIKRQMKKPEEPALFGKLKPRNEDVRTSARLGALALAAALENNDYLCARIRGIDAASFEIGCRPETFATEFRFLKSFVPRQKPMDLFTDTKQLMPKIGVTYHVGEDFLDISDGLRAIDEAIRFLHLSRGDRLGHALALGVDPEIHYRLKQKLIILPKQDMLDNLVWTLKRSVEFGITIDSNVREKLRSYAKQLLAEIYGNCLRAHQLTATLDDYYNAWKLRGDHPLYYENMFYHPIYKDPGRFCAEDTVAEKYHSYYEDDTCNDICRHNDSITCLLHYYHYGYQERVEGQKVCKVEASYGYIKLMAELQKKMRRFISEKGLAIECNLSSNRLIGTFGDYRRHPLFKFNSHLISNLPNPDNISVSLNTDDQGVFDTSLENEYALLVQCMSEMRDENSVRLYSDEVIYEYVDYVRRLSVSQTFSLPNSYSQKTYLSSTRDVDDAAGTKRFIDFY